MKKFVYIVLAIGGALFIAGMGFFLGRQSAKSFWRPAMIRNGSIGLRELRMPGRLGTVGYRTGLAGGYGEISQIEGKKITLKLPDGSTRIIDLSGDALIYKMVEGKIEDMRTGQKVMIAGGGFWNPKPTIIIGP